MTERCVKLCRAVFASLVMKQCLIMVDGLRHTASGAAAPLASPASLELAVCGHFTTSQLVGPNKGPVAKEHGTTVNPAMLVEDSARFE